jgi:Toprim-like
VFDFKTGYKGDLIGFIAEFLQTGRKDVIPYLVKEYGQKGGLETFDLENFIEKEENLELPKGLHFFSQAEKSPIRDQAYNYLVSRKIPEENIKELGYIYEPGTWFDRSIFIPFYENGRIVYFITRDFTQKSNQRYKNPNGVDSKQYVYNIDKFKDTIFIFEGVMDAISLRGQVGTAMLSCDLGIKQCVKILNKAPNTIVFVPDNDETGERTLDNNIKNLLYYKPPSLDLRILVYRVKGAKDFNESSEQYIYLAKCEGYKQKDVSKIKIKRSKVL